MNATIAQEIAIAERNSEEGAWAVFKGRNFMRFIIAAWPKIAQQFVGLAVFNTYATYFCTPSPACLLLYPSNVLPLQVQYAGNKDPFRVTVILSCVQLLSMIITATTTDQFGRRPLTVYPYAVTTVSELCLGIVGCFDYTKPSTSSLLVRHERERLLSVSLHS